MKDRIKAIVTILAAAVAFVNTILTTKGLNPIPFSEDAVYEWVSVGVNAIIVIIAWWKNQNITDAAQRSQKMLKAFKAIDSGKVDVEKAKG